MDMRVMDVYEITGNPKPEGARGRLTAWVQEPSDEFCPDRQFPAILILPGGGYCFTSAREAEPVAMRFYARGFSVFVLEYSCAPSVFPTALREAVMAMTWIRENSARLHIRADAIGALGFSAGGHLCGTLGTMYDCPEVADLVEAVSARPDGLCLCYPVAVSWGKTHDESFRNLTGGREDLTCRLSLDRLVRPDMPPVYLWHTRTDDLVPVRNSLLLAQAMEEKQVPFAMHIYAQGGHGVSTADKMSNHCDRIPQVSRDVPGWVEECLNYFEEIGLTIRDKI